MATISSLLADHVTLQVRSVDRLFLQGYVPKLMTEGLVIRFLLDRGFPIPSPAVLGKIGGGYVDQINDFIARNEIPTVRFTKGDVKEEIAREHFKRAEREDRYGVVMVGVAQEKTSAWRGWRDGGPDGHPHFVYRRQSIFPNNYYFYRAARRPVVSPAQPGGTRRESLGLMADRDPRGERDNRMPENRRSRPGVMGDASWDPCDMAKAGLPEAESPEDAKYRPPERHL